MATLRSHHSITALLILLQWAAITAAWVNSSNQVDLSWPPVSVWRDISINGSAVAPWNNFTANSVNIGYDCARFALEPNVARTAFPITGGRVQLNFSALDTSEASRNPWTVQFTIGQFSGLHDEYIGGVSWSPRSELSGDLDNMTWSGQQFADMLGSWCSPGLDVPATIDLSQATWPWMAALPSREKLVGMNATLGISIVKWDRTAGDALEGNLDQMTQCSYIRFTDITDPLGPCPAPSSPSPSPSLSLTANPSSTNTFSSTGLPGPSGSSSKAYERIIAIAVVVPIVLFLIIGCIGWRCFVLRKRRRVQQETDGSGGTSEKIEHKDDKIQFEVGKIENEKAQKSSKNEEGVEDTDSITVPPPSYAEALEDFKGESSKVKESFKE